MTGSNLKSDTANLRAVWVFLCCLSGAVVASADEAADIEVSGYAREMPPGAPMGAAYLTLRELAGRARVLERVELPAHPQGTVELHTTEDKNGVSRMRALKEIALPGSGTIEMRPGAAHLMVRGVTLKAGKSLSLRLVFADGSAREVTLPVRGIGAEAVKEEHHHGHHNG